MYAGLYASAQKFTGVGMSSAPPPPMLCGSYAMSSGLSGSYEGNAPPAAAAYTFGQVAAPSNPPMFGSTAPKTPPGVASAPIAGSPGFIGSPHSAQDQLMGLDFARSGPGKRSCLDPSPLEVPTPPQGGNASPVHALSALRTTDGCWLASPQLSQVLSTQEFEAGDGRGLRVFLGLGVVEDDVWATILVLAWLTRHSQGERSLWSGMWDKAITWLQVLSTLTHSTSLMQAK